MANRNRPHLSRTGISPPSTAPPNRTWTAPPTG